MAVKDPLNSLVVKQHLHGCNLTYSLYRSNHGEKTTQFSTGGNELIDLLFYLVKVLLLLPALRGSEENLELMRLLDEQYMDTPYYGFRRMRWFLGQKGYQVNLGPHDRILRSRKWPDCSD